jgi:hypothetical protein
VDCFGDEAAGLPACAGATGLAGGLVTAATGGEFAGVSWLLAIPACKASVDCRNCRAFFSPGTIDNTTIDNSLSKSAMARL